MAIRHSGTRPTTLFRQIIEHLQDFRLVLSGRDLAVVPVDNLHNASLATAAKVGRKIGIYRIIESLEKNYCKKSTRKKGKEKRRRKMENRMKREARTTLPLALW